MNPVIPHPTGGDQNSEATLRFQVTMPPGAKHRSRIQVSAVDESDFTEVTHSKQKAYLEEWAGSVCVRIYKTKWRDKKRRKIYRAHTMVWFDAQGRHREKRNTLDAARRRAREIGAALSQGRAAMLRFTEGDQASLLRARELLAKIGNPPIEVAVGIYTDLVQKLSEIGITIAEAQQICIEHAPKGVKPKPIPELVADLLAEKVTFGKGSKWLDTLSQQLNRFAARFPGPLHAVAGHQIGAWLDSLKWKDKPIGLVTRANYRAAVGELVRFAQAKGQISKLWTELDDVADPEPPPVEVEIYTNQQMRKLLGHTRPSMVPFTVLQAFAGIRHEELVRPRPRKNSPAPIKPRPVLDWRNINLETATIKIKQTVGKTKKQRLIKMHPNLVAWLKPYKRDGGPVCTLRQTANALVLAKRRAGLPSGRGELTNALRSSFISNRLAETGDLPLTALEAGNSPKMINDHYLELVSQAEALDYFEINPPDEVLPLFAWKQAQL